MREVTVLIIDDSEADSEIYGTYLEECQQINVRCLYADCGTDGIEMCEKHALDCILLDCNLPDSSGLEVLKELQALSIETPVILYSGYWTEELNEQAIQAGAYDFIDKGEIKRKSLERVLRFVLEKAETLGLSRQLELAARAESEAKTQFLARVVHEIRNPIHQILSLSRFLRDEEDGSLNEAQQEYLELIKSAGTRMIGLVNGLLDLAKLEAGTCELEYSTIDLREFSRNIVAGFKPLAEEKGLFIQLDITKAAPQQFVSSANRLEQIIANLISNAIKYTETGGVTVEVGVHELEGVEITVRDTGIGISPEGKESIFTPYQQIDNCSTNKGTGLGLSIAVELADLLGSGLTCSSEIGEGSAFCLKLPANPCSPSDGERTVEIPETQAN
jgi:signal transduction histidine kinase